MRRAFAAAALAFLCARPAGAVPLPADEVAKLCNDAEGPAHCMRLVEAQQLKRLPGLATRDGNVLKVTLFPSGSTTFEDVDTLAGGTSYALWDYSNELNAVVLWTQRDNDAASWCCSGRPGRNNWNAVCLAGVTGTALAMIESPQRRAFFVAAARNQSRIFSAGSLPMATAPKESATGTTGLVTSFCSSRDDQPSNRRSVGSDEARGS